MRDPGETPPHQWVPLLRPHVPDPVILDWLHLLGVFRTREPIWRTSDLRALWHCSQPAVSRRTQALIRYGLASRFSHYRSVNRAWMYRIHAHPGPEAFGLVLPTHDR
ncbi:MAG: hypothetical protein RLZZ515_1393 [Cyanobacteriota bacterium]